ncbi:hypothetical protein SAMN05421770_101251 [Granulicella rosea]|uniref:Uncharacterized protein n=1 Tax=Granulicella rosea TaxID=474952 RepID=A0A239D2N4_9BACT|nr:hypothetical protein SAMN05421770_101251 [Granulicella rosea]
MLLIALGLTARLHAQSQTPQQIIAAAVQSEIAADLADHTNWIYLHHDVKPDSDTLTLVAESPLGSATRKLEDHGHPLTPDQARQDADRARAFAADRDRQIKAKRDSRHDDDEAEAMMRLLPVAFLWQLKSETPDRQTLAFRPNPGFTPHTLTARVLATMAGEVHIVRAHGGQPMRIELIQGMLTDDVTIGWGLLARLRKGGRFRVERSEIAPGVWQITGSHIHMEGRALLFKSFGEQEDETMTGFRPSAARDIPEATAELGLP